MIAETLISDVLLIFTQREKLQVKSLTEQERAAAHGVGRSGGQENTEELQRS